MVQACQRSRREHRASLTCLVRASRMRFLSHSPLNGSLKRASGPLPSGRKVHRSSSPFAVNNAAKHSVAVLRFGKLAMYFGRRSTTGRKFAPANAGDQ
jgi:hypothetical protein